ncbi:hypothetical protein [Roseateles sp. LKC17W]|uniref:Uncharacterized protein n=1 Tax=Pelomonas margarita TaxID=3299031 RepID=A0ABW7FIE1_9BURK
MKARITNLKAPWPSGALVGAVVEFEAGALPAWAAGKCVPVGDDEEPSLTVPVPPEFVPEPVVLSEADKVREEAGQHIARLTAEFEQHARDMQAKLQELTGQNEALQTAKAEADSKVAELSAQLAAAEEARAAAAQASAATKPKKG